MYASGQEGFHHIAYLVSDFGRERQRWLDLGYALATELYADGVNAAYFDTRTLNGGFTEIHGDPPHIMGLFAVWKRAHDARDASTPATIEIGDIRTYVRDPLLPLTRR
jgi:hypothetical protein